MIPTVVPAYAAVFALIFVFLSMRVANARRVMQVALGTDGNAKLERYVRVQGNFAEYVPFALVLLAFVEIAGWPRWLIHALCLALLLARLAHAYGVSQEREDVRVRAGAMATTFGVFIVAAGLLLMGISR